MAALSFVKAVKRKMQGRLAIAGPSGSGKTMTAIALAMHLCPPGKRVKVIDTENSSATKYAGEKCAGAPGGVLDFDVLDLTNFHPDRYIEAQAAAEACEDCGAVVIDSGTHAWSGEGGVLEIKENAAKKMKGNDWGAWREATPHHNRLVNAWIRAGHHLIVCIRSKTAYEMQENTHGKKEVVRLGMQAEQRAGLEYEFDAFIDMDLKHVANAAKTRCPELDGIAFDMIRDLPKFAKAFGSWLDKGEEAAPVAPAEPEINPVDRYLGQIAAAASKNALDEVAGRLAREITNPPSLSLLRAAYTARAKELEPVAVNVPAVPVLDPPKGDPLSPGVDVPAMAAKPAAEKTPKELATAEILDAADKCKTPADLARLVLPPMKRAIDRGLFTPAEIEENRRWYTDTAEALKKAAAAQAAQP